MHSSLAANRGPGVEGDQGKAACALLVFGIGRLQFGIAIEPVQRVIPASEISPLPEAPSVVMGIIRIGGDVIPVIDPHRPFNSGKSTELRLSSRFIVLQSPQRRLALIADHVEGVSDIPAVALDAAEQLTTSMCLIKEVAATPRGVIYIYDIEQLLLEADEAKLSAAIERLSQ
jgi:purine-binding chemotaxis protein CheW